jgi:hypothetical protein
VKRFVIGTNRTTVEQDKVFLNILRTRWPHLGWWHQINETWLIIDLSDELTVNALRDATHQAFPGIYKIVIEVPGHSTPWAGWGQGADFVWVNEQWDRVEME